MVFSKRVAVTIQSGYLLSCQHHGFILLHILVRRHFILLSFANQCDRTYDQVLFQDLEHHGSLAKHAWQNCIYEIFLLIRFSWTPDNKGLFEQCCILQPSRRDTFFTVINCNDRKGHPWVGDITAFVIPKGAKISHRWQWITFLTTEIDCQKYCTKYSKISSFWTTQYFYCSKVCSFRKRSDVIRLLDLQLQSNQISTFPRQWIAEQTVKNSYVFQSNAAQHFGVWQKIYKFGIKAVIFKNSKIFRLSEVQPKLTTEYVYKYRKCQTTTKVNLWTRNWLYYLSMTQPHSES